MTKREASAGGEDLPSLYNGESGNNWKTTRRLAKAGFRQAIAGADCEVMPRKMRQVSLAEYQFTQADLEGFNRAVVYLRKKLQKAQREATPPSPSSTPLHVGPKLPPPKAKTRPLP